MCLIGTILLAQKYQLILGIEEKLKYLFIMRFLLTNIKSAVYLNKEFNR